MSIDKDLLLTYLKRRAKGLADMAKERRRIGLEHGEDPRKIRDIASTVWGIEAAGGAEVLLEIVGRLEANEPIL